MRLRRTLAVSLALLGPLGLVAACSDEDDGGAVGTSSDDGATVTTLPPATTAVTTADGARVVNPTPGLDGVTPVALDSVTVVDDGKLEAKFYGGVADCFGVDKIDVQEADDSVTITVSGGTPPAAAGVACIELAELQAVVVALASPLNDRVIIDGSSGAEVPLS